MPINWQDHHAYESEDWNLIPDWADHLASLDVKIAWDPGRHGPGNNLFFIINDTDGNWVELSAELEQLTYDRHVSIWPHGEKHRTCGDTDIFAARRII